MKIDTTKEKFLHRYKMHPIDGGVTAPTGFLASGVCCGIKSQASDLALIFSENDCVASGLFTSNIVKAAPVLVSQKHLSGGSARAIIANSGNANACTGADGMSDAMEVVKAVARVLKIEEEQVLIASTGVIGVRLPVDKVMAGIPEAARLLSRQGEKEASMAILTTDSFAKKYAVEIDIDGVPVRIGGMAKGSGMIHPNLATMLAFITTDVNISKTALDLALQLACRDSFNMITVDGDTSTNDSVFVMASGAAGNEKIDLKNPDLGNPGAGLGPFDAFVQGLTLVARELSHMIVRDGEGATKFVEIRVKSAPSESDARKIARTVATSNLVKTAIFGADANWGRILAAAGRSGVTFDPDKVDIYLGAIKVAQGGCGFPFSDGEAREVLEKKDITITIDLNSGCAGAAAWTCDLSYDYVRINASYRS